MPRFLCRAGTGSRHSELGSGSGIFSLSDQKCGRQRTHFDMAIKRTGAPTGWTVVVAIAYCSLEIGEPGECASVCVLVCLCVCVHVRMCANVLCSCDVHARGHFSGCTRRLVLQPGDILVFDGHFKHRGSPFDIPGVNDNRYVPVRCVRALNHPSLRYLAVPGSCVCT
jgi:hypothetical protein